MRKNSTLMASSLFIGLLWLSLGYACTTTPKSAEKNSREEYLKKAEEFFAGEYIFHEEPHNIKLLWGDADAFWLAVDRSRQPDGSFAAEVFNTTYATHKTGALDSYSNLFYGTKEGLYQSHALIPFYESYRSAITDKDAFRRDKYIALLQKLREYYPQAKFPDVYFAVGKLRQAGTALPQGLLIGLEMFQRNTEADYSKLAMPPERVERIKTMLSNLLDKSDIYSLAIHELMHFQQLVGNNKAPMLGEDLLPMSLVEGSAEFLSYIITNSSSVKDKMPEEVANEAELWQLFKEDRKKVNIRRWLYNIFSEDRGEFPADLGYWIGFRIAESYWEKHSNKRQAFYDILHWQDADEFLQKSAYEESIGK